MLVKLTPSDAFSYNYSRKIYNMRQKQLAELSLSLSYDNIVCGSSSLTDNCDNNENIWYKILFTFSIIFKVFKKLFNILVFSQIANWHASHIYLKKYAIGLYQWNLNQDYTPGPNLIKIMVLIWVPYSFKLMVLSALLSA